MIAQFLEAGNALGFEHVTTERGQRNRHFLHIGRPPFCGHDNRLNPAVGGLRIRRVYGLACQADCPGQNGGVRCAHDPSLDVCSFAQRGGCDLPPACHFR